MAPAYPHAYGLLAFAGHRNPRAVLLDTSPPAPTVQPQGWDAVYRRSA